jgi:cation diffusion facilitator CzcD-associated flavoprotein CzcO
MLATYSNVIVIGLGTNGLGAGYHLAIERLSYVILEAGDDLGAAWATPRCQRCDRKVLTIRRKPRFSRKRLQRKGSHVHLRAEIDQFATREHVRFGTKVLRAVFDVRAGCWIVDTTKGIFTAQFLIYGNGYFTQPHLPQLPDADRFQGEIVHTANLEGSGRFVGKDVVVLGDGSTAVYWAVALASASRSLRVLQRSPLAERFRTCLERNEIPLSTREIERFTANGIVLKSGERIPCDACVLATGYDLEPLQFDLYVGQQQVRLTELNCYGRLMLEALPNYFQPLVIGRSARSECLIRSAIRIMKYMRFHGFRTVMVDRELTDESRGIKLKNVLHGRSSPSKSNSPFELPSFNKVVSLRCDRAGLRFS